MMTYSTEVVKGEAGLAGAGNGTDRGSGGWEGMGKRDGRGSRSARNDAKKEIGKAG